jgi:hypothetical protein
MACADYPKKEREPCRYEFQGICHSRPGQLGLRVLFLVARCLLLSVGLYQRCDLAHMLDQAPLLRFAMGTTSVPRFWHWQSLLLLPRFEPPVLDCMLRHFVKRQAKS